MSSELYSRVQTDIYYIFILYIFCETQNKTTQAAESRKKKNLPAGGGLWSVAACASTVLGEDDGDVLLAEGADGQQHGGPLGGGEAEGHVLSGSAAALRGDAGRLRAAVLHHREGLLERVGHRGLHVEGHRHLCAHNTTHTHTCRRVERKEGNKRKERDQCREPLTAYFFILSFF